MNNFTTTTAAAPPKEALPRSGHVNEGKHGLRTEPNQTISKLVEHEQFRTGPWIIGN